MKTAGSANDHFRPFSGEPHLRRGGIHSSAADGPAMLEGLATRVRRSVMRERGGGVVANDAKLRSRTAVGQPLSEILVSDAEGCHEPGVDVDIGASKGKVSRVDARRETSWLAERDGEREERADAQPRTSDAHAHGRFLLFHDHNAPTLPPSTTLSISPTSVYRTHPARQSRKESRTFTATVGSSNAHAWSTCA